MRPLVLGMVGTDHHRFDRLVDWLDEVARRHPEADVVVQHGTGRPPLVASGHAYLTQRQLHDLLGRATAVVVHGGPASIMDARRHGHLPICVPRDPAHAEHVDDHQQRFAAQVGDAGVVRVASDLATLHTVLGDLLSRPGAPRSLEAPTTPATQRARADLYAELDRLADGAGARRRVGPTATSHSRGDHSAA